MYISHKLLGKWWVFLWLRAKTNAKLKWHSEYFTVYKFLYGHAILYADVKIFFDCSSNWFFLRCSHISAHSANSKSRLASFRMLSWLSFRFPFSLSLCVCVYVVYLFLTSTMSSVNLRHSKMYLLPWWLKFQFINSYIWIFANFRLSTGKWVRGISVVHLCARQKRLWNDRYLCNIIMNSAQISPFRKYFSNELIQKGWFLLCGVYSCSFSFLDCLS